MGTESETRALRVANASGIAFDALDARTEAALPRWIERGAESDGEALRPGRVWRVGDIVVKRVGPERFLRTASALRAARSAVAVARFDGLAAPAPLAALRWGPVTRARGSLLVSRFVAGSSLLAAWRRDARAVAAFPAFLARLHASPFVHGDLHPENVLWDGTRWLLLDLEALRARTPFDRRGKLALEQWARIVRALDEAPEARALHARYAELAPRAPGFDAVLAAARALPPIPPERLEAIRAILRGEREHVPS
ncbi:MAG: phosphotransferase [Planctomycetes bacterium]|nr:phosphotransferase [Planctomycetota bacterium]